MIRVFEPWISFPNILEVNKALFQKQISGSSNYVSKFEEKFSNKIGMSYGVAVSNGSVALDLAMQTLELNEDDEVILPSFSIISCLTSIIRAGVKPVFADVDINTWNISLSQIKKLKTSKTKAVLVVHTYGLPAEIDKIQKYCSENNLILIEDTAEAHGIKVNNKFCGSFSDLSTFSFYANKHVTSGEGGIVLTNNENTYQKLIKMRNLDFDNKRRFVHENFYWNYRISGLQAALAYSQIDSVDKIIKKKQQQGTYYNSLLSGNKDLNIPEKNYEGVENNYWVYGIVLKNSGIRDALMTSLYKKGIETRPFFWPLHLQPAYLSKYRSDKVSLPNAEKLGNDGLYLPMGAHIKKNTQKFIVNSLESSLKELKLSAK